MDAAAERGVAFAGAAALVAAAVWYGVVVASDDSSVTQEAFYGSLSVVGFLCLAATALFLARRLGGAVAWLAGGAIGAGAALWAIGTVVQLGGDGALARLADGDATQETLRALDATLQGVNDAFQLAAMLLLGAGLLGLAAVAGRTRWARGTVAVALLVLALGGAYAARAYDVVDLLLVAGGAVALPAWLVWSGRSLAPAARD